MSRVLEIRRALAEHWPEYGIEAGGIAAFMVGAVAFSVLIFHEASPLARALPDGLPSRFAMGLAMAATALALIYSPFGKRSGAHWNPAVTLAFWRLRRVRGIDAAFYVAAQLAGGVLGVLLARAALGALASLPPVEDAITRPGREGVAIAFLAEVAISFALMSTVLYASSHARLHEMTGLLAAVLVCAYITFESPLSGMSMNPARSLGSALVAGDLRDLWIYFVAPPLGMLLAAEAVPRALGRAAIACAKLHHRNEQRCIFLCRFDPAALRGADRGTRSTR